MKISVPDTHKALLTGTVHGVLTTVMPDGAPQASVVWVDYDGECVLVNTTLQRQKGRNMRANPKVAVLVVDPANASRWIQVQGCVVELVTAGAEAHADRLTRRYCPGKEHFYGDVFPAALAGKETRVIARIAPTKISVDAVFK